MSFLRATRPFFVVFVAFAALDAQETVTISGELTTDNGVPSATYEVHLAASTNSSTVQQTVSNSEGKFEFNYVAAGPYTLFVKTSSGDIVGIQDISAPLRSREVSVHITEPKTARPITGVISATTLQHRPPKKAIAEMNAALKASSTGEAAKAHEHLVAALAIDPDFSEAHTNLGADFYHSGKYELSYAEFEAALKTGPKDAMEYCNLAAAALALQRKEEAERELRQALQVDSRHAQSNYLLGRILASEPGHYEEAVRRLRLATPEIPNANVLLTQLTAKTR